MPLSDTDDRMMQRALELAVRGEGLVEPNPMVGCVIAQGDQVVGEAWHERFGGPHAEAGALAAAGDAAQGATAYVTLEPCAHTGKTPPCAAALIEAGVRRVVVAAGDPNPQVDGKGISQLREAGIEVEQGLREREADSLLAPFRKLTTTGLPWVIAKWAMTLDGKIATRTGDSQWISSEDSRKIVHQLRGRVDAVIIGRRTAIADNPLLTARPAGPRVATRVVLGAPPRDAALFDAIDHAPVLVVARRDEEAEELQWAADAGAEVLTVDAEDRAARFAAVVSELGRRQMTNVLLEGGGGVLGAAFDSGQVDEIHVFVGPKLIGGQPAPSPIGGAGVETMADALRVADTRIEAIGGDAYLHGRIDRSGGVK